MGNNSLCVRRQHTSVKYTSVGCMSRGLSDSKSIKDCSLLGSLTKKPDVKNIWLATEGHAL